MSSLDDWTPPRRLVLELIQFMHRESNSEGPLSTRQICDEGRFSRLVSDVTAIFESNGYSPTEAQLRAAMFIRLRWGGPAAQPEAFPWGAAPHTAL